MAPAEVVIGLAGREHRDEVVTTGPCDKPGLAFLGTVMVEGEGNAWTLLLSCPHSLDNGLSVSWVFL